jgi:integrase
MLLTKANVASLSLPAGKTDLVVFDDDLRGFGLRLRASGRKYWVVQYRIGRKQRRLNLGAVTRLSAEEARKEARKALSKVNLGHDPQSEKQVSRSRAVHTLAKEVEEYLAAQQSVLRPRSFSEAQRYLRKAWKPLHELAVHEIKRSAVADRLKAIAKHHGPVASDRARAALSAFFNWAIRDGRVEQNPVAGTNKHAGLLQRERVLSDSELVEIWQSCPDSEYGMIVRLLMLIPARRSEIANIAWSELDLGNKRWQLSAERSKNRRAVLTPLTDQVLDILGEVSKREDRDLLFGRGKGGYAGWSRSKAELDAAIHATRLKSNAKAPAPEWILHDLRRTCATRLADMGVEPHVIEALLNHVSGHKAGVAGVYNRATYDQQKRAALTLWAEHLTSLTSGHPARVVAIRADQSSTKAA